MTYSAAFTRAVSEYVTYLQGMLEIRDWRIFLKDKPCDLETRDVGAYIEVTYGRRVAQLQLCHDFTTLPSAEQQHYIIHEVCHVLTNGCATVIKDLEEVLGQQTFAILEAAWRTQVEHLVDQLAYIVRELLDDGANNERLWANVLAAGQGEDPYATS